MFIGTGSFIIRGKRNFISPQRLELGQTLMFCLNEESIGNHIGERKPKEDKSELIRQQTEQEEESDEDINPEEVKAEDNGSEL